MAWCPKCNEEYEDDIEMCGDCNVPLVKSLEDISTERMLLVLSTEEEAQKAIDFLEYSQIEGATIKPSEDEHGQKIFRIYVEEKSWDMAAKLIQGFVMAEKEEPNKEDYYFDEYETINVEGDSDLAEIKSSYLAFVGLGGIIAIAGILNILGLASFLNGNTPTIFTGLGIVFVLVGVYTKVNMKSKVDSYQKLKKDFESLYEWYLSEYPISDFHNRNVIDVTDMDDGAKYFAFMDVIVKECHTTDITDNEKMINTVAEKVFNQLL